MSDDKMRDRLILPVLIPVGALAFVLSLALLMSQILLNVPAAIATAVAMMIAFNLLIAFSVMAAKPEGGRPLMMALAGITVLPLILGAAAASGIVPLPEEEEEHGPGGTTVQISANNLVFDTDELLVPADEEFVIAFNNEEAQPHNVSILEAQGSANALFRGEIITGPQTIDYQVPPVAAGEYYFQCDVHPNMAGTVIAGADGGGDGEAAAEEH